MNVSLLLYRLAAFATALVSAVAAPVEAQTTTTIDNIATVAWDVGATRVTRPSNRVTLTVNTPDPDTATIDTFRFVFTGSGTPTALPTTMCQSSSGSVPITLSGAFAGVSTSPAQLAPSTSIRAGEPLVIALNSLSDNKNATVAETKVITLQTPSGDRETITLTESGPNTGRFLGMINTVPTPPAPVANNCHLSVASGEKLDITGVNPVTGTTIATNSVNILVDPYGIVFDSGDGSPVAGSRVTLIDVATGLPADVFGDDGVSIYPNSVITGATVTDSGGTVYTYPEGDYRFPFVRPGNYRLVVEPPVPYTGPSKATPAELAGFTRPGGLPYTIVEGSYSRVFTLDSPQPVRIDIPVDQPAGELIVSKSASTAVAVPGDGVRYQVVIRNGSTARATASVTLTDQLPAEMRLQKDTVRIDGRAVAYSTNGAGTVLTVPVPALPAARSVTITYVLQVRPDAKPGQSMNRAQARDARGAQSAVVDAFVRIARDGISDRMTIIGRITDGGCTVDPRAANGIAGVRVMLEDGSYAVTDQDGRYHFEGVLPGTHVVQIDPSTLPVGQVPAKCVDNARSGDSAISRFVEGRGGALLRADFSSTTGENKARIATTQHDRPAPASTADAAGANRDWFAGQAPGIGWVFPEADHNPRTKAVRIAIKHMPGQSVRLTANGRPVDPVAFDGTSKNAASTMAVSLWRAVEIGERDTQFVADVLDADGKVVETLRRTVHFSASPMRAQFVREKSLLVADGVNRPVIAVRLTDRDGRPVHQGLTGDYSVPAPYFPAVEADAQNAQQLSGLERARPVWHVEGDDGIAYIELEPTTASGTLNMTLPFRDGDVERAEKLDLWLDPGNRPWTVVGYAAGTVGFNTLDSNMEKIADGDKSTYADARIALYAKGKVKGKWLMTLAYDSDKTKDDARFGGTIDPSAYYTIYADRSERRYDAQSVRKLYVKLERPQFYALFGDYETNISDPQLSRYVRSFNGVKAEFRNDKVGATAFAADTPYRHRREEIQGTGLSGPYALATRDILANSERITIETRDRLIATRILEARTLIRHIDYDIDYIAGTLTFREPILSRSSGFDPQFIVADYEVDGVGQRVTNAGGRVTWNNEKKSLTVGATALHNEDESANTNLGGLDVKYRPSANTEIRAEFAVSDRKTASGAATAAAQGTDKAWLVEAEHHSAKIDALAYAREEQKGFGVGQTNGAGSGVRKFGADGRVRLTETLSVSASAWHEDYLDSSAKRDAAKGLLEYRAKGMDLRAGVTMAKDTLGDGTSRTSNIAQVGAAKRFFGGKVELDAQTEFALGGQSESVDFPARHKIGARYHVTSDISLVGAYEIAKGDSVDAKTARIGFDLKPWTGGRMVGTMNQQDIGEYGPRTFAAYGLAQSLPVGKRWTVDFTLDGNKTVGGINSADVLNKDHPVASGGYLAGDSVITEDFTAITTGASYRGERWSWTGRAEARDGTQADRIGLTTAMLRQIGEGRAFGGQFSWYKARTKNDGVRTEAMALALSWAHRPSNSDFSFLDKLELRGDKVKNAVFGESGPIGGAPLLLSGNAVSKRIINSFSMNYSPVDKREDGTYRQRSEVSVFWGARYVFDRFGEDDIKGMSNVFGVDARLDMSKHVDLGFSGTLRQNPGGRAVSWSGGPTISLSPIKNSYITLGYNMVGFRDKDFEDSRYTRKGLFATLKMKFDQTSLSGLGLGR